MKLIGMLQKDRELCRFNMISADADVSRNNKFVINQIKKGNLVGGVALHEPDFEFANFSLPELVEIASSLAKRVKFSDTLAKKAPCDAKNAKELENWYRSTFGGDLKGENWGRALGQYARKHPKQQKGDIRPMLLQIEEAKSWYQFNSARFTFDPVTFKLVPKSGNSK